MHSLLSNILLCTWLQNDWARGNHLRSKGLFNAYYSITALYLDFRLISHNLHRTTFLKLCYTSEVINAVRRIHAKDTCTLKHTMKQYQALLQWAAIHKSGYKHKKPYFYGAHLLYSGTYPIAAYLLLRYSSTWNYDCGCRPAYIVIVI